MKTSVIISTYNQPTWLEKSLWGYLQQTHSDFTILIADDGSGPETKNIIEKFSSNTNIKTQHIWHEDNGFQKSAILNKAILAADADYLIFTDGDCIPRTDFIETHVNLAAKKQILSGGYCKLPLELSKQITKDDITSQRAFDTQWLTKQGKISSSSKRKIGLKNPLNKLADKLTTTKATWNGCNASTWKEHILAVNGHNEEMHYGGQDREMGQRLINLGLKSKQIRHQAVLLHLDHKRGYRTKESIDKNLAIRALTKTSGSTWTDSGIKKKS